MGIGNSSLNSFEAHFYNTLSRSGRIIYIELEEEEKSGEEQNKHITAGDVHFAG